MMRPSQAMTLILTPANLRNGEKVQARHPWQGDYEGTVETTAPHLGIFWLRCEPLNERKLFDLTEYQCWKHPA